MRQLVSIRPVTEIRPIEGADAIELAVFEGWQCVAKKSEFKVGDNAVYIEIDAAVPLEDERFSFLIGRNQKTIEEKPYAVIRSMKLRGALSQGLALPVSNFPEFANVPDDLEPSELGLGGLVGIVKYEKPTALGLGLQGFARGNFPSFIPKTDEERVQNLTSSDFFQMIKNAEVTSHNPGFYATVKLDGSSMTIYHNEGKWGVCSRNLELDWENPGNANNAFVQMFLKIKSHLEYSAPNIDNVAIQGELVAPNIQGNFEKVSKPEFYIFKNWCIDTQNYWEFYETRDSNNYLDLNVVPIADVPANYFSDILGEDWENYRDLAMRREVQLEPDEIQKFIQDGTNKLRQYFLDIADGPSLNHDNREGVVIRMFTGESFKAISNKYLLKQK
jgi:RNA ligase (TIGR02306 family)